MKIIPFLSIFLFVLITSIRAPPVTNFLEPRQNVVTVTVYPSIEYTTTTEYYNGQPTNTQTQQRTVTVTEYNGGNDDGAQYTTTTVQAWPTNDNDGGYDHTVTVTTYGDENGAFPISPSYCLVLSALMVYVLNSIVG